MLKHTLTSKAPFMGVALFVILSGAIILAIGLIQWVFNVFADMSSYAPSAKVIGGLVVLALGYIVLELEMMRTKA